MNLNKFRDLEIMDQYAQILAHGQLISHCLSPQDKVFLYKLFDFYVEISIRVDGEFETHEYINAGSPADLWNKYPNCSLF